jgi:hypothetical protein
MVVANTAEIGASSYLHQLLNPRSEGANEQQENKGATTR